ncbi:thioesterase II family protein [Streptomyces sp.]|uniref:thioesterase II family protein n=1 Tax=Streptomyces sp. TaxID=1931 RepID=UPI002F41D270
METTTNDLTPSTVFFPGAGSFGREFQLLVDALKPAAWLVKYPGRYGKDFGVPAESFDGVVRACTEQIARRAPARPVLFGHSFGAYVAYATALRLQDAGIGVSALVAVGASAPGRLEVSEQATGTLSDAATYLDSVDPGALADAPSDDWREVVVETAVHDLRLLRQFDAAASTGVHCPILAVRGDADPLTSDAGVREWEHSTDGVFSLRVFPGGHSDFLRSPACTSWLRGIRDGFT